MGGTGEGCDFTGGVQCAKVSDQDKIVSLQSGSEPNCTRGFGVEGRGGSRTGADQEQGLAWRQGEGENGGPAKRACCKQGRVAGAEGGEEEEEGAPGVLLSLLCHPRAAWGLEK